MGKHLLILLTFISLPALSAEEAESSSFSNQTEKVLDYTKTIIKGASDGAKDYSKAIIDTVQKELPSKTPEKKNKNFFEEYFSFAPNSIILSPASHQNLDSGDILDRYRFSMMNPFRSNFSLFSYLSITKAYYPDHPWTWILKFTPTYSLFKWSDEGEIKMMQASIGPKLIWQLKKGFGALKLAAGIGPILMSGEFRNSREDNKLTVAPLFQVGYYKFFNKHIFVGLSLSSTVMLTDVFVSKTPGTDKYSSLESFTALRFIMGVKLY